MTTAGSRRLAGQPRYGRDGHDGYLADVIGCCEGDRDGRLAASRSSLPAPSPGGEIYLVTSRHNLPTGDSKTAQRTTARAA